MVELQHPQDRDYFDVAGRVTSDSGRLPSGLVIRAYDRELRSAVFLGETPLEGERYAVRYPTAELAQRNRDSANVEIRAYDALDRELARSEVRFRAGPHEEVDL